jgi:NAD(P)-dependent dehydrogenase (short-subunit alcohol dehydrogenase family)
VHLAGGSAVVTGGGGGLGSAAAAELVAAGMHVVIADVDDDKGKSLAAELGERAAYAHTDVLEDHSVRACLREALRSGPLRVVVTAHGGGPRPSRVVGRDGRAAPLADFREKVDIHLVGTYNVLCLAAEAMAALPPDAEGNRGVIVNTASIAAYEGQIGQTAYAAAKAGIIGLTLPAARDLAVVGVRVAAIAPGFLETAAMSASAAGALGGAVPFPSRLGRPGEFAALVRHVCENDYLNGEVIRLDGAHRFPPR